MVGGLGDLPCRKLDEKTPLESAEMPNLDFLATRGEMGYMFPVRPGYVPESDEAIISIFGNKLFSSSRGQLEAVGSDIDVVRGDLAFRTNFASIDSLEDGNIIDRRAGRTLSSSEASALSKAINGISFPVEFYFKQSIQHRGALVFRGGFSDNVTGNDMTYIHGRSTKIGKVMLCRSLDDEENTVYTANLVNAFLKKVYDVLDNHPVNIERKRRGLLPANYLLIRGAGIESPKLLQYGKWVSANYTPLEIGFSEFSGMKNFSFNYPKFRGVDSYENLYRGLRKACNSAIKVLKRNHKKFDYAYVHFKEIDVAGHDNKPLEKKEMLEYLDRFFFKFLRKFAPPNKIKVVVTGDHCTPCKFKDHSADFVPVLFYNNSIPKQKKFCEREARKGLLGGFLGKDLFRKVGFS